MWQRVLILLKSLVCYAKSILVLISDNCALHRSGSFINEYIIVMYSVSYLCHFFSKETLRARPTLPLCCIGEQLGLLELPTESIGRQQFEA